MEILKDLEILEDILSQLKANGQSLNKKEQAEVATEMRKDLKQSGEMDLFKTIADVAKTVLPLIGPIIALI
jgi:hypothetical protein